MYVCVTPSIPQVELESIKLEYANVQLECNAADERAKLIASEVIGLEEKVINCGSPKAINPVQCFLVVLLDCLTCFCS